MKFLAVIDQAGEMATSHNPAIQNAKYITLVTDVPVELDPATDFQIGKIKDSLPAEEFRKKYRNIGMDAIANFNESGIKIMWSESEIKTSDSGAVFLPNLVIRLLSYCKDTQITEFLAQRNKYGSSLVRLSIYPEV